MTRQVNVSIIGTAGRRDDASKMSKDLYHKMVQETRRVILKEFKLSWDKVTLVSGGAAWADHVAVTLYKMYKNQGCKIKLYVPCTWDPYWNPKRPRFTDTGERNWRTNPGGTSNYYHRQFAYRMGVDYDQTLKTLDQEVMDPGHYEVIFGFKARNTGLAKSEYLIAMTFGEGDTPKDGGTKDTWDKSLQFQGTRWHIPLGSL